jgi:hypothetical protein
MALLRQSSGKLHPRSFSRFTFHASRFTFHVSRFTFPGLFHVHSAKAGVP